MIGVGKVKQYGNVLDKPLTKGKQEVPFSSTLSLSLTLFLFQPLRQDQWSRSRIIHHFDSVLPIPRLIWFVVAG